MVRAVLMVSLVAVLPGCTEANPLAEGSTGSSGADADTSATMSSTSPTSTDATSAMTADPTVDPSSATTGDTTGSATCPADTHVCVAPAPEGWQGPAAMIDEAPADRPSTCAGEPDVVAYTGVAADDADCDCECAVGDVTCGDATLYHDDDLGCTVGPTDIWEIASCDSSVAGGDDQAWAAEASVTAGPCVPQATAEVPPVGFASRLTACAVTDAPIEGCAEPEQCVATPSAPFESQLCIWRDGEHGCPGDGWSERTLAYRDIVDTRGCTACTCGTVEATCTGSIFLSSSNCGGMVAVGNVPIGAGCIEVNTNGMAVSSASVGALTAEDASCPASTSVAQGEAEPESPITFCCQR